jgi:hypothetical protein
MDGIAPPIKEAEVGPPGRGEGRVAWALLAWLAALRAANCFAVFGFMFPLLKNPGGMSVELTPGFGEGGTGLNPGEKDWLAALGRAFCCCWLMEGEWMDPRVRKKRTTWP